ncbi:MAG TPA: PIN domain-containing protein [Candidatus Nanoarchaeia archaeon]|nr:PIN domain-containing protein [Candidatus Nanoarchaeia archaeon]
MYLDTDIILALIKQQDWLKPYVRLKDLQPAKTSTLTIVEARIVLLREYSRKEALDALKKVKDFGIQILPLDEKVMQKSQELMHTHEKLQIFDAIHAACAIIHNETLVSTDSIYQDINEVHQHNPRTINPDH